MVYDSLFIHVDLFIGDNQALARAAKRNVLKLCHVNLKKLNRFAQSNTQELSKIKDANDLSKMISDFKKDYRNAAEQKDLPDETPDSSSVPESAAELGETTYGTIPNPRE
jgi:hypothetical protein